MNKTSISWVVNPDGSPGYSWNCFGELSDLIRRRKPSGIFIAGDIALMSNERIASLFGVMAACPQHTFYVLTKRAKRMREWFAEPGIAERVDLFKHVALAGKIGEVFAPERSSAIHGFPDYSITNKGRVLSLNGSEACLYCGMAMGDGLAKKKFCSHACASKAHYEKGMGRWSEPVSAGREMSFDESGDLGHCRVMLYRGSDPERKLVHRLVLEEFDRPARNGEQCCHIDSVPTNNALWNLRWGSPGDNHQDKKRNGTARSWSKLSPEQVEELRRRAAGGESSESLGCLFGISGTQAQNIIARRQWNWETGPKWPLLNVMVGVTVENQAAADERIPELLQTPAACRFLSCEPILEELDLQHWIKCACSEIWPNEGHPPDCPTKKLNWVIVGGESGPNARPCHVEWIRSIVRQCREAGVACWVKQLGSDAWTGDPNDPSEDKIETSDRAGGNMAGCPSDLRIRQLPKVET